MKWLGVSTGNSGGQWTLAHGFFLQMGGLQFYDNASRPVQLLDVGHVLQLIKEGRTEVLLQVSEEEINDKNKGDVLTKSLVVVQTTWFVVQCIARWIKHLPVSELEVMTLSFAALNAITYALWWKKPQNVNLPMHIRWDLDPMVPEPTSWTTQSTLTDIVFGTQQHSTIAETEEQVDLAVQTTAGVETVQLSDQQADQLGQTRQEQTPLWQGLILIWSALLLPFHAMRKVCRQLLVITAGPIWKKRSYRGMFNAYDPAKGWEKAPVLMFAVTIGALFGGLHLISWSSPFPTTVESLLWRISALYIMVNPMLLAIHWIPVAVYFSSSSWLHQLTHRNSLIFAGKISRVYPMIVMISIFYIFARIAIIVAAFASLRDLPPGALVNIPWASFLPHL